MIGTNKRRARGGTLASALMLTAFVAAGVLLLSGPAHARTFTVNSTGDGSDFALDGSCDQGPA